MSGVGSSEFILLLVIGLIVLGPKRLPEIASQIGGWIGQARRMTRAMRRQLEDELSPEESKSINPAPAAAPTTPQDVEQPTPNDDDSYSPLHDGGADPATASEAQAPKEPDK